MAQHDYGFSLYLRKFSDEEWLPMAVNTREEVDAMIAHVLGSDGAFDVVRVIERVPVPGNVFRDNGERHTRAILPDPRLV